MVIRFSNNLRLLRKNKRMTQYELAELLGIDRRTISVWEKCKCEPDFAALADLCEIFDEDFDNILT